MTRERVQAKREPVHRPDTRQNNFSEQDADSKKPHVALGGAPRPPFERQAAEAQGKAAFLMSLRAAGIQDLNLLRAIERVPREIFVPHRFADLASRPIALPLRCGQTLPEPWLTARMIEALAIAPCHRVLEIGTGSGYATALIANLAREVLSIERFQSLAIEAEQRLAQLAITNAAIAFGDGLAIAPSIGPFERIIVHGLIAGIPESLAAVLCGRGIIVAARSDQNAALAQHIAAVTRNADGEFDETRVCSCRLQALIPGEAVAL